MQKSKEIRLSAFTGLFAALIFLVTAYLFHIPTPATGGYIHLGDAFVYLAASLLPLPYSVAAAGIGEGLSDLLTGSAAYALPTFLIKSAMALCFTAKGKTLLTRRNRIATVPAGLICVGGYYLTEIFLLHSVTAPLAEIPANLVQALASAVIYLLLGKAFDRVGVKNTPAFSLK
jgi:uncharacterized repeat protein (TIGR04002 family)